MILVIIIVDFNKKARAAQIFSQNCPKIGENQPEGGQILKGGGTKGGGINFERGGTKNKKRGGMEGFFLERGGTKFLR